MRETPLPCCDHDDTDGELLLFPWGSSVALGEIRGAGPPGTDLGRPLLSGTEGVTGGKMDEHHTYVLYRELPPPLPARVHARIPSLSAPERAYARRKQIGQRGAR
jgi:hypothetical protein